MSWLARSVSMVLLVLWGLATAHCALERVTGLEVLACVTQAGGDPCQEQGCESDGCATVESGHYRLEPTSVFIRAPLHLLDFCLPFREPAASSVLPPALRISPAPPELARGWQFSFRAARPPRAPSSVS